MRLQIELCLGPRFQANRLGTRARARKAARTRYSQCLEAHEETIENVVVVVVVSHSLQVSLSSRQGKVKRKDRAPRTKARSQIPKSQSPIRTEHASVDTVSTPNCSVFDSRERRSSTRSCRRLSFSFRFVRSVRSSRSGHPNLFVCLKSQ